MHSPSSGITGCMEQSAADAPWVDLDVTISASVEAANGARRSHATPTTGRRSTGTRRPNAPQLTSRSSGRGRRERQPVTRQPARGYAVQHRRQTWRGARVGNIHDSDGRRAAPRAIPANRAASGAVPTAPTSGEKRRTKRARTSLVLGRVPVARLTRRRAV